MMIGGYFMNRQVVSFLSLFGLVLVLSVYYVLLPTNLFIKVPDNAMEVGGSVHEAHQLFFEELYQGLENKHEEVILSQEAIVASANYNNSEKEVALNTIAHEYNTAKLENKLVGLILAEGYANAYVEYLEEMIKVLVYCPQLTNQQAAEIVSLVMLNSETNLLPELQIVS